MKRGDVAPASIDPNSFSGGSRAERGDVAPASIDPNSFSGGSRPERGDVAPVSIAPNSFSDSSRPGTTTNDRIREVPLRDPPEPPRLYVLQLPQKRVKPT